MINKGMFQEYLEGVLSVDGADANPIERSIVAQGEVAPQLAQSPGYLLQRLKARTLDRKSRSAYNEDFIIGPLPSSMTLHEPQNLIQIAENFYAERGLRVKHHSVDVSGYEETLNLEGEETRGFVQFDLGQGFRADDNLELWVTTVFS